MNIILASSSTYRAAQLSQLGIKPSICPANIDETVLSDESAQATAARLAKQKAKTILDLQKKVYGRREILQIFFLD